MKRTFLTFLLCIAFLPFVASCSWEELPAYEEAEITAMQFYTRWAGDQKDGVTGEAITKEIRLTTTCTVDSDNGVITANIVVPAVSATFPESARNATVQTKLWGQASISTAARMEPLDGTAALGTPDDWTKEKKFQVTAANGTVKIWTVKVASFTK